MSIEWLIAAHDADESEVERRKDLLQLYQEQHHARANRVHVLHEEATLALVFPAKDIGGVRLGR